MSILVRGFSGLGDNVYQRPFVRALLQREDVVYLETPLPEIYADLGNEHDTSQGKLIFVAPEKLPWRTQKKLIENSKHEFKFIEYSQVPACTSKQVILTYGATDLLQRSITQTFEALVPLEGSPYIFDLPKYDDFRHTEKRPIALIRPATLRREWLTPARSCDPVYIEWAANYLYNSGFCVISIADLQDNQEWIHGNVPKAHVQYHHGELNMKQIISLFRQSAVVVGGIGMSTPFSIAAGVRSFLIFGGRGAFDCLHNVTDPRMDLSRVGYAIPDQFCRCQRSEHECNKQIVNFQEKFVDFTIKTRIHDAFNQGVAGQPQ